MTIDLRAKPKAAKRKTGSGRLTYRSRAEAEADRMQQLRLLDILDAVPSALRRDECGAWRFNGKDGHVYTWGDNETWVAYLAPGSARKWNAFKKRVSVCQITQDGDDEGCLRFGPSLTPDQGQLLRKALGIRKRPRLSPDARELLRSNFITSNFGVSAARTAETPLSLPKHPSGRNDHFRPAKVANSAETDVEDVPA